MGSTVAVMDQGDTVGIPRGTGSPGSQPRPSTVAFRIFEPKPMCLTTLCSCVPLLLLPTLRTSHICTNRSWRGESAGCFLYYSPTERLCSGWGPSDPECGFRRTRSLRVSWSPKAHSLQQTPRRGTPATSAAPARPSTRLGCERLFSRAGRSLRDCPISRGVLMTTTTTRQQAS